MWKFTQEKKIKETLSSLVYFIQRLAEDRNPANAAAASKAVNGLKEQWEIERGNELDVHG